MNHLIDKLLFLVFFVVIATTLYRFYPYRTPREKKAAVSNMDALANAQPEAVQQHSTRLSPSVKRSWRRL